MAHAFLSDCARGAVTGRMTRLAAHGLVGGTEGGWLVDPILLDEVPMLGKGRDEPADPAADAR